MKSDKFTPSESVVRALAASLKASCVAGVAVVVVFNAGVVVL